MELTQLEALIMKLIHGRDKFQEIARTHDHLVAPATWTAVTFDANNFTASSGNWTLASGDQLSLCYILISKTMTVSWNLDATTVSATPATLKITVPASKTATKRIDGTTIFKDNGVFGNGGCFVVAGGTEITLIKDFQGTAWATAANTTGISGQLTFEIE